MTMQDVIDEIKFELTGDILEIELDDNQIALGIKKVLRELERYYDETTLVTVPFASCIDLKSDWYHDKVSSIYHVYRTEGVGEITSDNQSLLDPLYAQYWQMYSTGGISYNISDYVANYAAYSTVQQIKNTLSTDLTFKEDRRNEKLYLNNSSSRPTAVTIEYIPKITCPDDIVSDYWIDIMVRMSVAMTKVAIGRIRSRYTLSNAVWAQDGEKILEEGNKELEDMREKLRINSDLVYTLD